jgi:hypothetical protein
MIPSLRQAGTRSSWSTRRSEMTTPERSPEFELDVVHYLPHGGVESYSIKAGRAAGPLARRNGVARPQSALLRPVLFSNGSREMD